MMLKNRVGKYLSANKKQLCIFLFFLVALLFFAWNADWIYDESTTYFHVHGNSLYDLLTYDKFKLANNHLFNSMYFRLLERLHSTSVGYYRLFGVVGFVLFYIANSRILRSLNINYFYIIFLTVAPYFFYFIYGRGYSLAIGCIAMSFYYLLKYIREPGVKYEYLIVVFGCISSLSVFSFLYGFLSILVVFGFFKLKHIKSIHTVVLGIIVLALLSYISKTGKIVNANDPDIIGVNTFSPFKYGTISSIFSDFSYRDYPTSMFFNDGSHLELITCFKILVTLCIIIPVFYIRKVNISKIGLTNIKTILAILIVLPFLFMIAAHLLAGALYPLTRAVFYIEYFILLFILISTVSYSRKLIFYIPAIIICLTSLVYCSYYYYDLSRPNIKDALIDTKSYPLYVLFTNDKNVSLINKLYGIHKKNITEGRGTQNIIPPMQKDTSKIRYIICWPQYTDSCLVRFKHTSVSKLRNGCALIRVGR